MERLRERTTYGGAKAMDRRESNYEIMKHRMQAQFAAHDMDAICREWELAQQDGAPRVTLLGRQYRIDRRTGAIQLRKPLTGNPMGIIPAPGPRKRLTHAPRYRSPRPLPRG